MASNRPQTPVPGLYYRSTDAGSTDGLRGYLTTALSGITVTSSRTITVIYTISTTKNNAVQATDLLAYIQCIVSGPSGSQTLSTPVTGDGGNDLVFSVSDPGFDITSISITLSAIREFNGITNGFQSHYYSITIPISTHTGFPLTFLSSGNNYINLPIVNTGTLCIIKNTTNTIAMIAPSLSQPLTQIESSSYIYNGYPQLRLQAYQCVGLLYDGTRWNIVLFYGGAGTGQSRNGYAASTTTEVAAANIASDVIYSKIDSKDLRVNLPAASSRQKLMIVAERTENNYGYQLQINKPVGGNPLDGRTGWDEFNLNITDNRQGNCAVFLISNGTTWYIASIFDMTDMDNYSNYGTTFTTTSTITAQVGINTTGAVTSNVWDGRSYDIMSVAPLTLATNRGALRIFKQNNTASCQGIGFRASGSSSLFTNTYTNGPGTSNGQLFIYGSNYLMAMLGIELNLTGTNRIYFLGQYPSRF